jgi:C1A family cysteine protease
MTKRFGTIAIIGVAACITVYSLT